jgi:hypothetical protein
VSDSARFRQGTIHAHIIPAKTQRPHHSQLKLHDVVEGGEILDSQGARKRAKLRDDTKFASYDLEADGILVFYVPRYCTNISTNTPQNAHDDKKRVTRTNNISRAHSSHKPMISDPPA